MGLCVATIDAVADDASSIGDDSWRVVLDRFDLGHLEHLAVPLPGGLQESGEILQRMDSRLIGQVQAGCAHKRRPIAKLRVEPEVAGKRNVGAQCVGVSVGDAAHRQVQVAGHPCELAVDVFLAHVLVDGSESSQPGVPHGCGMVASEVFREARQAGVGHACQVRRGMRRVALEQLPALQQGNALPAF